ncbi:hypothetical protein N9K33_02715 [Planktomarina temperata]|nr:hypothetical protein [Planktomarina temperata]
MKKISLICCLLFGMPANAATKEERMSSCMEMHTALFQSALGGAPYEHLLQVVNFYGSVLKEGEEEPVLFDMMLEIYREIGKAKMRDTDFDGAEYASRQKVCQGRIIYIYWQ